MRSTTRKRLIRLITSALISGDFSRNEVEEIALALESGDVLSDVATIFREVFWRIEIENDAKSPADDSDFTNYRAQRYADLVYDVVQRRRMSREELLNLMKRVDSNAGFALKSVKVPIRQLLFLFFSQAPQNKVSRFFDLLGVPFSDEPATDKYLDAITNRESR